MLKDRQMKAEATHAVIEAIQADVKMFLTQVEANQKAINEVKMMLKDAKGVHEEPSTSKRALVFLTTAAAGIGWFVMNAIGGRSGAINWNASPFTGIPGLFSSRFFFVQFWTPRPR